MTNDTNTPDPRIEAGAKAWDKHMGGRYAPDEVEELSEEVAVILVAADAVDPRKPRIITDRHEDNGADHLPPLSVVLSAGKPAIMQHDGTFMEYDGSSWDAWEMTYPLTIIHEPKTETTR
ncbi:hypothetical protein ACFQ9D_12085 [Arthrobacter koreensis]|uniref:hypothetical protein n=1 Tax=Arthrobacter koreensis TaxID=199136 RepID=UPI0036451923